MTTRRLDVLDHTKVSTVEAELSRLRGIEKRLKLLIHVFQQRKDKASRASRTAKWWHNREAAAVRVKVYSSIAETLKRSL